MLFSWPYGLAPFVLVLCVSPKLSKQTTTNWTRVRIWFLPEITLHPPLLPFKLFPLPLPRTRVTRGLLIQLSVKFVAASFWLSDSFGLFVSRGKLFYGRAAIYIISRYGQDILLRDFPMANG